MRKGALPAGTFTDDTEMALALAESLLFVNPLDPADLAARFAGWFQLGPSDVGVHTSHVLRLVSIGKTWKEALGRCRNCQPGRFEQRFADALLAGGHCPLEQPALLAAETGLQSEVTHLHADCMNACVLFSLILHKLIHRDARHTTNAAMRQAVSAAVEQVEFSDDLRTAVTLRRFGQRRTAQHAAGCCIRLRARCGR